MTITEETIENLRTVRGGFTTKSLRALGVKFPLRSGWKNTIIGKEIDDVDYYGALENKDTTRNDEKSERLWELKQTTLRNRGFEVSVEEGDEDGRVMMTIPPISKWGQKSKSEKKAERRERRERKRQKREFSSSGASNRNSYAYRNLILKQMGFKSYEEYQNSKLWIEIRKRVRDNKDNKCFVCSGTSNCLHHRSYERDVMRGDNIDPIVPLCNECHHHIEFESDRKTKTQDLKEIDRKLLLLQRQHKMFIPPTPKEFL